MPPVLWQEEPLVRFSSFRDRYEHWELQALPGTQASPSRGEETQTAPLPKCTKPENSLKRDLSKNANHKMLFFPFKQNTVKIELCFGLCPAK